MVVSEESAMKTGNYVHPRSQKPGNKERFSAALSGNSEVPPHSTEVSSVSQMAFGKSTKLVRVGESSQLLARGTWVK